MMKDAELPMDHFCYVALDCAMSEAGGAAHLCGNAPLRAVTIPAIAAAKENGGRMLCLQKL